MDRLPTELLCQITKQCSHNTLVRLRAINKRLTDILTPLAFDHIYIGWTKKHFDYLKRVAGSRLAKYVHLLTINTEVRPLLSEDEWMKYIVLAKNPWQPADYAWDYAHDNAAVHDFLRIIQEGRFKTRG
jgi:hypothetical protein